MTKASDNAFPSILITEGTEPSAPAAGKQRLYIDSTTHLLKATNSSGTDRTIEGIAAGAITSSGLTMATARLLGRTTGSTGAVEEITVGSGLSLSAGSLTATGGSGLTQSYIGYNTIGGSVEQATAGRQYMKSVTLAADSQLLSIDAYMSGQVDNFTSLAAVVLTDAAGVPTLLIGAAQAPSILMTNSTSGFPDPARWLSIPMGIYLTAGTYWIGIAFGNNYFNINYDSGADVYQANTAGYVAGAHASLTQTTSARKYSIRGNILS